MEKILSVLIKIMNLLPLVMQAVEMFSGPGTGTLKKKIVKQAVKSMVAKDPVYDDLIDVAIETIHKKASGQLGVETIEPPERISPDTDEYKSALAFTNQMSDPASGH